MNANEHRDRYASQLTSFEQRLLDGLHQVAEADPATRAGRHRPGRSLVAAGSVAAVLLLVGAGTSILRTTPEQAPAGPQWSAPATAPAAPADPYHYLRVVSGVEYLSMDYGHEVKSEVRSEQELWLSTGPGARRTLRVRLDPYREYDCWTRYRPDLCERWLAKHPTAQVHTEPVDRTLRDVALRGVVDEHDLPFDVHDLLAGQLAGQDELPESLPSTPERLAAVVTDLAMDASMRVRYKRTGGQTAALTMAELDPFRRSILLALISNTELDGQVRNAAFQLAAELPAAQLTDERAADRLGRPGSRLVLANSADPDDESSTELVFDPVIGMLLSVELYFPPPPDTRRPPDPVPVRDYTLYLISGGVPSLTATP